MTKPIIPKAELKVGEYYQGHCRNAETARWNGTHFIYRRHKFGDTFLETICHPEDDNGFDLFLPYEIVTWGTDFIPLEA